MRETHKNLNFYRMHLTTTMLQCWWYIFQSDYAWHKYESCITTNFSINYEICNLNASKMTHQSLQVLCKDMYILCLCFLNFDERLTDYIQSVAIKVIITRRQKDSLMQIEDLRIFTYYICVYTQYCNKKQMTGIVTCIIL